MNIYAIFNVNKHMLLNDFKFVVYHFCLALSPHSNASYSNRLFLAFHLVSKINLVVLSVGNPPKVIILIIPTRVLANEDPQNS